MWLRVLIVLIVLIGCIVYAIITFTQGHFPPMVVMALPTVTYVLVENRWTSMKFGKGGFSIEQKESKDKEDGDKS